jgi:hypothetical protein
LNEDPLAIVKPSSALGEEYFRHDIVLSGVAIAFLNFAREACHQGKWRLMASIDESPPGSASGTLFSDATLQRLSLAIDSTEDERCGVLFSILEYSTELRDEVTRITSENEVSLLKLLGRRFWAWDYFQRTGTLK